MVLLGLLILLVSCMLGVAVLLRTVSHARDSWMTVSGIQCSLTESLAVDEKDLSLPSATGPPGPLAVWRQSDLLHRGHVSDCVSISAVQTLLPLWPMISTDCQAASPAQSSDLILPSALHCSL